MSIKFDTYLALAMLIGLGLFLIIFLIVPVSFIVIKAFWINGELDFSYFFLLAENETYREALTNSLILAVFVSLLATLMAFPLALIQHRFDFYGQKILSALLLLPMMMPPFVGAIGTQRFFAQYGVVNLFLLDTGLVTAPIDWLSGDKLFWVLTFLECLHLYPIMYLNIAAALANIDPSLEEAAQTLGASAKRCFKTIVWPLAQPGLLAGISIVFIWSLTDLGTPLMVGFNQCLPVKVFNLVTSIEENQIGYALVFVAIAISIFAFLVSKWISPQKRFQMMAKGHVTSIKRHAGLKNLCVIYPLFLGTIGLALLPHLAVLISSLSDQWFMTIAPEHWTFEHYRAIWDHDLASIGIQNSIYLSGLACFLDIAIGLPLGYICARRSIPFSTALDALVMIPLALPGIILAFSYVVTFTDTVLDPFVNPVTLLVIAYSIRRLPFMVRSCAAGFAQSSQYLEEASYTLGAGRIYTLLKISMPLVYANLIAGALLCFCYAMLDVSDSLILAMKDRFYPLTKAIYTLYLEQGSGEYLAAALGGVSMVVLASCIIAASSILGKKMGELFRS